MGLQHLNLGDDIQDDSTPTEEKMPLIAFLKHKDAKQGILKPLDQLWADDNFQSIVEELRATQDKKTRDEIKSFRLAAGKPNTRNIGRKDENALSEQSGLLVLDYDDVSDAEVLRQEAGKNPYCRAAFLSPSGLGVKVIVSLDRQAVSKDDFKAAFKAAEKAMDLGESDQQCKNPERLCFVSWDEDVIYNENSTALSWKEPTESTATIKTERSYQSVSFNDVESALTEIDADCSYEEWLAILMSLKSLLLSDRFDEGEIRHLADTWSKTAPERYTEQGFEHTWNSISAEGDITIGTLFEKAKEAGWERPEKTAAQKKWEQRNEWDVGEEANLLLRNIRDNQFIYVEEEGLYVADKDGYYHYALKNEGLQASGVWVMELRNNLKKRKEEKDTLTKQWETSLSSVSSRRLYQVIQTLQNSVTLPESPVVSLSAAEIDNGRVFRLKDGTFDCMNQTLLSEQQVRSMRLRKRVRGLARKGGSPCHPRVKQFIDHYTEPVLHYVWHLLIHGGKEVGIVEGTCSDSGKSTLAKVLQDMIGQISIQPNHVLSNSQGDFNLSKKPYLKICWLQWKKWTNSQQFKPVGLIRLWERDLTEINVKFEREIKRERVGSLLLLCGDTIAIDWQAQGILPTSLEAGGRIRGLVHMPDLPMPKEMGQFWHRGRGKSEWQDAIDGLFSWFSSQIWSEKDAEQVLTNLHIWVNNGRPEWQERIIETYEKGDPESDLVLGNEIRELCKSAEPKPEDRRLTQFVCSHFDVEKTRIQGAKMTAKYGEENKGKRAYIGLKAIPTVE